MCFSVLPPGNAPRERRGSQDRGARGAFGAARRIGLLLRPRIAGPLAADARVVEPAKRIYGGRRGACGYPSGWVLRPGHAPYAPASRLIRFPVCCWGNSRRMRSGRVKASVRGWSSMPCSAAWLPPIWWVDGPWWCMQWMRMPQRSGCAGASSLRAMTPMYCSDPWRILLQRWRPLPRGQILDEIRLYGLCIKR